MKNYFYFGNTLKNLIEIENNSVTLFYLHLPKTINVKNQYLKKHSSENLLNFGLIEYRGEYTDYLINLAPYLWEAFEKLTEQGVLYLRGDNKILHYVKALLLDKIFGRKNFVNEVIWAVEKISKSNGLWPNKHENILIYSKSIGQNKYNLDEIDRLDYMAPALVTEEKRNKGKLPTDTWWETQINEEKMLKRIINASTDKNDLVINLFPKNNLFGGICLENSRRYFQFEKSNAKLESSMEHYANRQDIEWVSIKLQELSQG